MNPEPLTLNLLPPCQKACPIRMDVQGYLNAIAREEFEESLEIIRETNPLPSVCGRVCTHPCEAACRRNQIDEPLSIMALKRAPLDYLQKATASSRPEPGTFKKEQVAIVGSGPAGLSCAHDLALLGYKPTIFEALPVLGGMLRVGIPEYRLPKKVLQEDIDFILRLGVEVRTKTPIGEKITLSDLTSNYQAVFLAIGAHQSALLGIEGEDLAGVIPGTLLLRQVALGEKLSIGEKVVVIGGGDTAIDAARCVLRLGTKEVLVVYRRSEAEMPVHPWDLAEAKAEGVKFKFLMAPLEIEGKDGKVTALKCIKMKLGKPGKDGRPRPIPVPNTEFKLVVDTVIPAIGQFPNSSFVGRNIGLSKTRQIEIDEITLATSKKGIFAGGDGVTGPRTVVEAIAAGKRAALGIHYYLRGFPHSKAKAEFSRQEPFEIGALPENTKQRIRSISRHPRPSLAIKKRLPNFNEVDQGFTSASAIREAERCLNCGSGAFVLKEKCVACLTCLRVCPFGAPFIRQEVAEISEKACQACGICVGECPEEAIILKSGEDERITRELENLRASVVAFVCLYGYYGEGEEELGDLGSSAEVKVLKVLCTAKISRKHLLQAFEKGATSVLVASCQSNDCHFLEGSFWAEKRGTYVQKILKDLGLKEERLKLFNLEPPFLSKLSEILPKAGTRIPELGTRG